MNTYEYDGYNQLKKVTTPEGKVVTYKYNGDGLMTERTENGVTTRYYYDGTNIIAEANVVNSTTVSLTARYLRGQSGQLISREDAAGNTSYYSFNGHGDVTELRDSSGSVLNTYTYDIWGNPQTTQETVANPFRYSGEYLDVATGLQYLRARWYGSFDGRFLSEDTYEGDWNQPLTLNLYTYTRNNPITRVDPTGHVDQVDEPIGPPFNFAEEGETVSFKEFATKLLEQIQKVFGGEISPTKGDGMQIKIPDGKQPITIRVMNAGSGNRPSPYYRVTTKNGSLDFWGNYSSDPFYTHTNLNSNPFEQINTTLKGYYGG